MKLKDIILTANANLRKSKLRTFLTASAVFIGALTFMLTTGAGYGLRAYLDEQVAGVGAKDALVIMAKQNTGSAMAGKPKEYNPDKQNTAGEGLIPLRSSDLQKIQHTQGIKSIDPFYPVAPLYITTGGKKYVTTLTQGTTGLQQPLKAGKLVDNSLAKPQITLPPSYVSLLGFKNPADALNEQVTLAFKNAQGDIFTESATVVGVQEKTFINNNSMTANMPFVKQVFEKTTAGLPDYQKDRYDVAIAKFDSSLSDEQVQQLKKTLDKEGYRAQTLQDQLGTIKNVVTGIIIFLDAFAVIALLAASFGIVNTLLMAVQERTREIGLMKALGMRRSRIFMLFALEAVLIGFWGGIIALGVANLIGRLANHILTTTVLKDFEGLHALSFPAGPMALIILAIMAVAFLAATLPARRASRLDPIEALRYE